MTVPTTPRNFELANNQDWEETFNLTVAGVGDVISAAKVHLDLRPSADSANIALSASLDNGLIMVTDLDNQIVTLSVRVATMRRIAAGTYVYDLLVERPTGRTYRLYAGTVTLDQGVTELQVTQPA